MSEQKATWKDVVRLNRFVETENGKENKYFRLVRREGGGRSSLFVAMGVGRNQTMIKLSFAEAALLSKVLELEVERATEEGVVG